MFEITNMSPDKFAFFIPYKTRETTRSQRVPEMLHKDLLHPSSLRIFYSTGIILYSLSKI